MIDPSTLARARTLLCRLELVSHGGTQNLNASGRAAERGLFPPGGVNRKDDREPGHPLKSHEHFKRRLAGAPDTETVLLLIGEMELSLRAWTHAAMPPKDSIAWRFEVAKYTKANGPVAAAERYEITRQYAYQLARRLAA